MSRPQTSQCKDEPEEASCSFKFLPSPSPKGKRKSYLHGESSEGQSPRKRRDRKAPPNREAVIQSDVKHIMRSVLKKLHQQGNAKLNDFLRTKIKDLETDKRELIGVFGGTGAGKSSLINAIIAEEDLLPTADDGACTSVMIKVESNLNNSNYQADIEFITPEDWEAEVWSMKQFLGDNADQNKDDVEKLSALYGKEWKEKFPEKPSDPKYFREIPEFLQSRKKTLTYKSAEDLYRNIIRYTRTSSEHEQGKGISWFWPLVKCVTIKVPHNHLLQHVTLVDLPGSGDRNKSRDKMWKEIVRDCSTVWIVAEIKRATSEKEPWEILENTCSLMGHGGQCQRIHFICTMSDFIGSSVHHSKDVRDRILQRNDNVKIKVKEEFDSLHQVKKHFSDDSFQVFTVSSKEFREKQHLDPEDTEIPDLQEFLKNLNDCHSETFNYVSGAHGILSLMHGANSTEGAEKKTAVCAELEKNLEDQLGGVQTAVEDAHRAFETRLTEGVETSKSSCEENINSFLYHTKPAVGFHTLKSVVQNDGVHKPKKGKQINLNEMLASWLTDSIDEEFRKTFPNEDKSGSFNGAIRSFSLDTEKLMKENQSLELQLIFLNTEEQIIKTKLNDIIRDHKKTIYSSLTDTIKEKMLDCYKRAASCSGTDSLINMKKIIADHVKVKNKMFEAAKAAMLKRMDELKATVLDTLQETLEESIEISLKTDDNLTPDVSEELEEVNGYYKQLKRSSKEFVLPDF